MLLKFSLFRKKIVAAFIVVLPGFLFSQADGLVAKYSFNYGKPNDERGTNHAKAYNVKLAEDRFGNSNSAYFFQGNKDSYLNLGTSSVLKPKSGSISLWVKIDEPVYRGRGVPSNDFIYTRSHDGDPDFNEAYIIGYDFDVKKISAANSNSQYEQISLRPATNSYLRVWYHIVFTFDNNYACFYLNGALEAKTAKNFETHYLNGDSVIVGFHPGIKNIRFFHGIIDDVEIYNRVISPAEVLKLYNAPNPNKTAIILHWILLALCVVIVITVTVLLIRKRIANVINTEKEKNQINARLIELETKAIRAQMNPHFIFNSLNTLQRFILEDDKTKSYTYLIEFSKLLRKLLESSESDTISLKDEIEILTAYLDIEKLRFDNSFEYKITSGISNPDEVYIPFMLVQPFAENAIWHGLLNKEGIRSLHINFNDIDDKRILCEVDDNGVGREHKKKEEDQIKKKSLALDFIKHRLELIEKSTGIKGSLEIIDKKDAGQNSLGTTIKIIIPKSK